MSTSWRRPGGIASTLVSLAVVGTAGAADAGAQAPRPGQKVALVTGSTSGLGREVAWRLASAGWHVIVHGRSEERGWALVDEIVEDGVGTARFYQADFASLDEVRRFANTILSDYRRLDLLINNAGIGSNVPAVRTLSEDGHELRFQVNYLSGFLLTRMLLPLIRDSRPARIVNVSSLAQRAIDFDDVMLESGYSGGRAYAQSKLAQAMYAIDLAEELAGDDVIVTSLHPATYMDTRMVRAGGIEPRSTVAEGAAAVLNLVLSDVQSGQFYNGLRPARANEQAYDRIARDRLRRLSEELIGVR